MHKIKAVNIRSDEALRERGGGVIERLQANNGECNEGGDLTMA